MKSILNLNTTLHCRQGPSFPSFLQGKHTAAKRRLHIVSSTDFHQNRLASSSSGDKSLKPPLQVVLRTAERDDELEATAWLRAKSFYAYPPERKFAGEIHQIMVAEEELEDLKAQRLNRMLDKSKNEDSRDKSLSIIALCPSAELAIDVENEDERKLLITDDGDTWLAVVGSLDIYAMRAIPGEALIGDCQNPAYLANVCTSIAARRRGVGEAMLKQAREIAKAWNVDGLYVHTMAVNEVALKFYERNGFVTEKEESSNQAHYRGRCLDGIEGLGRTVLLRFDERTSNHKDDDCK